VAVAKKKTRLEAAALNAAWNELGRRASGRQRRLYHCACCRLVWESLEPASRHAVELAERLADGLAGPDEVRAARQGAVGEADVTLMSEGEMAQNWNATMDDPNPAKGWDTATCRVVRSRLAVLQDIVGGPPPPAPAAPAWLRWNDGAVVRLAQAAYQERQMPSGRLDTVRLLVLADALEEAGCTDAQILGHLRSGGQHVLGCFVLDILLR
jgi:hypothetical protein